MEHYKKILVVCPAGAVTGGPEALHQLTAHMNALGLPILNDRMYPPVAQTPDDDYSLPLQLLAKSIAFTDPVTGQARHFQSQLTLA